MTSSMVSAYPGYQSWARQSHTPGTAVRPLASALFFLLTPHASNVMMNWLYETLYVLLELAKDGTMT